VLQKPYSTNPAAAAAAAAAAVEELPHDDHGQLLRPGVVWFNENLDDAVIDRIDDELDETDLLLIIGEGPGQVGS
jgi:NAD-dependent SIR2 family protein deacetylase